MDRWVGEWGSGGVVSVIFLPQRCRGAEGNEGRRRLLGRGVFEGKIKKAPRSISGGGALRGFCF
jgi:hypothetical protein